MLSKMANRPIAKIVPIPYPESRRVFYKIEIVETKDLLSEEEAEDFVSYLKGVIDVVRTANGNK